MENQQPSIGRIVLYHSRSKTFPAIVLAVHDIGEDTNVKTCDLFVLSELAGSPSITCVKGVYQSTEGANVDDTWSWPPRI